MGTCPAAVTTASDWAKVSAVLSELFERLPTLPDLLFQHCLEHSWLYGTKALGSPEAGVRHMGAASRLDPCLYRLHIVPPSFAPMPMPAVAAPVAEAPGTPLATPGPRMALEARIAVWALIFGIIQAGTGVIALVIAI